MGWAWARASPIRRPLGARVFGALVKTRRIWRALLARRMLETVPYATPR